MKTLAMSSLAIGAALAGSALAAAGGPSPGVAQGCDGVASPARGVRYVALPLRSSTVVAAVRVRGGRVVRFRELRGRLGVPIVAYDGTTGGLSSDGRTLVLASVAPVRVSRFVLLRPGSLRTRSTVTLRGRYAFDALSPGGRMLYLIELLGSRGNYRVRAYDVARRRLVATPVVAKGEEGEPMRGLPAARVVGAGGRWAFTLYQGGAEPFVHALDTVRGAAVCIDLPRPGASLALRGRRLLVHDARGRRVATVDTRRMRVVSPEG